MRGIIALALACVIGGAAQAADAPGANGRLQMLAMLIGNDIIWATRCGVDQAWVAKLSKRIVPAIQPGAPDVPAAEVEAWLAVGMRHASQAAEGGKLGECTDVRGRVNMYADIIVYPEHHMLQTLLDALRPPAK